MFNVASGANAAPSYRPAAARPGLPKESLFHRMEEEAADAVDFVGRVGFLHDLGIKLYGLISKPKQEGTPLTNTGNLTPKLERGAQPTDAGIAKLAKQGVRTVINLRVEENLEGPAVQRNGMRYVYMPLPAIGTPTVQQGLDFLSAVTDPANGKVFFHCQHGADRTGAMAAIYRVAAQGWSVDQALAEMPQYHFHQGLEDEKVVFVRQFAKAWAGMTPAQKAEVLHRSLKASA